MSDIISKWIQNRMGIILDTSPDVFALKTANGRLLAELLRSYHLIGDEQLKTIEDSDVIKQCHDNLNSIAVWLKQKLDIVIEEDEFYEIIHGVGTASMHLFYQVLLAVQDRGALDFVADKLLTRWTETKIGRFEVEKSDPSAKKAEPEEPLDNVLAAPLLSSGDVIHWYKDRLQALQKRCLEAREKFLSSREQTSEDDATRKRFGDGSGAWSVTGQLPDPSKPVKKAPRVKPRRDFYIEAVNDFDRRTRDEKTVAENADIAQIIARQSDFEKRIVSQLGRIKHQKEALTDAKVSENVRLNDLRESELARAALIKDKVADEVKVAYYIERERLSRLHRHLWAEKRRLKEEMRAKMASSALSDMIDVALKMAEYRQTYGRDLNERETSDLKTIFIAAQPIFDLVEPVAKIIDDAADPADVAVADEVVRQNGIDRVEFERYVGFECPWTIKHVPQHAREALDDVGRGLNVLGHLVHRVLDVKYSRPKPRLPHVPIRACVTGLKDAAEVATLRRALDGADVAIVEVSRVVESFVAAYVEDADLDMQEKREESTVACGPRKGAKKGYRVVEGMAKYESKSVQTPAYFPSEETRLSERAQLGKTAHEVLTSGHHLTDYLVAAMLAEYLATMTTTTGGWVLVNYPVDFAQASAMEETFTGIRMREASARESCSICDDDDASAEDLRTRSVLLPRPGHDDDVARSVLTAYVKAGRRDDDGDPLNRFYTECGVLHWFQCHAFDDDAATQLRKVIVGDVAAERKSSDASREGEAAAVAETAPSIAGDPNWRYSTSAPPDELQIALATVWECVEEIYVEDLKQALFARRLILNTVPRYVRFVKDRMAGVASHHDPKPEYLLRFQMAFNEFDVDCREDDEFKGEMHCRIDEFRERLSEICDRRMMESEGRRRALIESGWVRNLLRELMNVYVSMFQIEMERFVETIRFVGDYFSGVFTKRARARNSLREELQFVKYTVIDGAVVDASLHDVDREPNIAYFQSELDGLVERAKSHAKNCQAVAASDIANLEGITAAAPSRKRGPAAAAADDDVFENAAPLIEEWRRCVRGETARVHLRLDLLKRNAVCDIGESIRTIRDAYRSVFEAVRTDYEKEMENVAHVCDVFASAVEAAGPVDGEFEVRNGRAYYVVREHDRKVKTVADGVDARFPTAELSRLVDVLLDLSPTGYMPAAAFKLLLQDVVWCEPTVPKPWSELDAAGLDNVLERLFGDGAEFVYWKDFVVHNTSYPGESEVLRAWDTFRARDPSATQTVTESDFDEATTTWWWWFDRSGIEEVLRKMYRVAGNRVDYAALLLDFCKDESVGVGFAKALGLAVGKRVCWDAEVGRRFVEDRERILKTVRDLIDGLVDEAVRDGDDVRDDDAPSTEVSVGPRRESRPEDAEVAFFVPLDVLMAVVAGAVPRDDGSLAEKATRAYERLRRANFDGAVLAHELLNDDAFLKLVKSMRRFEAVDVTRALSAARPTNK